MSLQITVLDPNDRLVEAFFVSKALHQELARIATIFKLESLSLAFLQETKYRAIAFCSRRIKTAEPNVVLSCASAALDWFDELQALIKAVQKLAQPDSLSLRLD